jgi:hypothetical protein
MPRGETITLDAKAPPAARLSAANALLDRGYGKPAQEVSAVVDWDFSRLNDEDFEEWVAC